MRTALLQLGYNDVHHMAAVVATDGESAKWMVLLKQSKCFRSMKICLHKTEIETGNCSQWATS